MAAPRQNDELSINQTCEQCRASIPTMYCTCTGSKIYLCDSCFIPHRKKNPKLLHQVVAAEENPDLLAYQQRCASFAEGKKELLGNLDLIDHCCEEMNTEVEELVGKLYAYRDSVVVKLQAWKGLLTSELHQAVMDAEAALPQESALQGKYANALRHFVKGNLELFKYRVDTSGVETAIQGILRTEYPGMSEGELRAAEPVKPEPILQPQAGHLAVSPLLYVTSGFVKFFNLDSCCWGPAVKLSSPITSDGSQPYTTYTLLDQYRVLCCGGKYDSENANRAYVIFTTSDQCTAVELPRMNRRRYAAGVICVDNSAIVFGGNCITNDKDEFHKTGEMLKMTAGHAWTFLPGEMKDQRDEFTPFEYERKIYLCGGKGSTSIEVFNLDRCCFQPGPSIKLPESTENVACVLAGRVTIISSNFTICFNLSAAHPQSKVHPHKKAFMLMNGYPVVSGNFLYWTVDDSCFRTQIDQYPTVLEEFS